MSKGNPTNGSHGDALAALHGLGGSGASEEREEKQEAVHEEEAVTEDAPAQSASGFVGMLAKNNGQGEESAPSPTRPTSPAPQPNRPTPKPQGEAGVAGKSPRMARTDEIRMAKEVTLPAGSRTESVSRPGVRSGPGRGPKKVPGWYHVAVPIMFTLSSLLGLIGLWAVGAVIYMATATPKVAEDIGYPLISWDDNVGDYGGISKGSWIVAIVMLAALPVALGLIVMAVVMQRHASKYARAMEGK